MPGLYTLVWPSHWLWLPQEEYSLTSAWLWSQRRGGGSCSRRPWLASFPAVGQQAFPQGSQVVVSTALHRLSPCHPQPACSPALCARPPQLAWTPSSHTCPLSPQTSWPLLGPLSSPHCDSDTALSHPHMWTYGCSLHPAGVLSIQAKPLPWGCSLSALCCPLPTDTPSPGLGPGTPRWAAPSTWHPLHRTAGLHSSLSLHSSLLIAEDAGPPVAQALHAPRSTPNLDVIQRARLPTGLFHQKADGVHYPEQLN